MAERIQRHRTKGWRMPEGAVYVGRPTIWGNPYRVVAEDGCWLIKFSDWNIHVLDTRLDADTGAVAAYANALKLGWHSLPDPSQIRAELAGKDLVCWCPPGQPCHADILLRIANGGAA